MAKKKTFDDYIQTIVLIVFVFSILGWLIWSIYSTFYIPEKDNSKTIKFEVTGVLNSENASTLVQIHWECIQYCMSHTSGTTEQEECWNQCSLLGKEGCNGK
jgi:hypothetical protein